MSDIVNENVQTVPPTATAGEAWALMRWLDLHHLLVKEGSEIIGVISAHDLSRRGSLRAARPVADLLMRDVVTLAPADTIRRAASSRRRRAGGREAA